MSGGFLNPGSVWRLSKEEDNNKVNKKKDRNEVIFPSFYIFISALIKCFSKYILEEMLQQSFLCFNDIKIERWTELNTLSKGQ